MVGHVTKEGTLAGPRVLEHVVDTVLSFDGDRGHALRLLHAAKHRFGATDEVGLFEMATRRPARRARRVGTLPRRPAAGAARLRGRGGARGHAPVLVEVQSLVIDTAVAAPRRSSSGLDGGRLAMLLAVLEQHAGVALSRADVYASVAGGLRVLEPGVDLALVLAVAGARLRCPTARAHGGGRRGRARRRGAVGAAARAPAGRGGAPRLHAPRLAPPGTAPVAGLELVVVPDVGEAVGAGLADHR